MPESTYPLGTVTCHVVAVTLAASTEAFRQSADWSGWCDANWAEYKLVMFASLLSSTPAEYHHTCPATGSLFTSFTCGRFTVVQL